MEVELGNNLLAAQAQNGAADQGVFTPGKFEVKPAPSARIGAIRPETRFRRGSAC